MIVENQQEMNEKFEQHPGLNEKIWDANSLLRPEIKQAVEAIVQQFCEDSNFLSRDDIEQIKIVGSNASYNYNEDSDLDVHIVVDMKRYVDTDKDKTFVKFASDGEKTLFNKRYELNIDGIGVEMYVEDVSSPATSNGVYDVEKDEWVKFPERVDETKIDYTDEEYEKEYEIYKSKVEVAVTSEDIKEIQGVVNDLYKMRAESLSTSGEPGMYNQIFKDLRKEGLLEKIRHRLVELKSKQLSRGNEVKDTLTESVNEVKQILSKLKDGNRIRAVKKEDNLPAGFSFKSSSGNSGEVTYKGTDYAYAIVKGDLRVMTSAAAGSNWSETLYKECLNEAVEEGSYREADADELMSGMVGNASDDDIDSALRYLTRSARMLKVPDFNSLKVLVVDIYSTLNDIAGPRGKKDLAYNNLDGVTFVKDTSSKNCVYLYFRNEEERAKFLEIADTKEGWGDEAVKLQEGMVGKNISWDAKGIYGRVVSENDPLTNKTTIEETSTGKEVYVNTQQLNKAIKDGKAVLNEAQLTSSEALQKLTDFIEELINKGEAECIGKDTYSHTEPFYTLRISEDAAMRLQDELIKYHDMKLIDFQFELRMSGTSVYDICVWPYGETGTSEDEDEDIIQDEFGNEIRTKQQAKEWLKSQMEEYGNTYAFPPNIKKILNRLISVYGNTYFWFREALNEDDDYSTDPDAKDTLPKKDTIEYNDIDLDIDYGNRSYETGEYDKNYKGTVSHTLEVNTEEIIEVICDEISSDTQLLAETGMDKLSDEDYQTAVIKYAAEHYYDLYNKYEQKIKDYFRDRAEDEAYEEFDPYSMEESMKEGLDDEAPDTRIDDEVGVAPPVSYDDADDDMGEYLNDTVDNMGVDEKNDTTNDNSIISELNTIDEATYGKFDLVNHYNMIDDMTKKDAKVDETLAQMLKDRADAKDIYKFLARRI